MPDHDKIDNTSSNERGAGYYAVNPQRVIQIVEMFNLRPSHFTASGQAGAHKMYYDAKKIVDGKTSNQWGHHTLKSIQGFCQFTQLKNDVVLPWQELIEHVGFYDGKEGTGPRTGNVLLTENRLQLNAQALVVWRERRSLSQSALAMKSGLPERLLVAMESGDWKTVAVSTAKSIIEVLDIKQDVLFTPIRETAKSDPIISSSSGASMQQSIKARRSFHVKTILASTLVLALISFFGYMLYSGPQENDFTRLVSDSHWQATIVGVNDSIIVEPSIKDLWAKGAYLHLRKDGQLGYNWTSPNNYSYIPSHSWTQKDNKMSINFGDISYTFDLNQEKNKLITLDNENGVFKMTIQEI